jgi:hypothetical protein
MNIPGLIGIEVFEFCTRLEEDGYVLQGDAVKWERRGFVGPNMRVRPADGFDFAYNEVTDSFDVTPKLEKPITYTIQFTAKTQSAVKEVHSLLNAVARHTTTFSDFRKEECQ